MLFHKKNRIKYFFKPKSVAVIGASHDPTKLGSIIFKNFVDNFEGKVFPVNPDLRPILNKKVYSSIKKVPGKVDLAVIIVPAKIVPKIIQDCIKKKVKSVIVISAGFSEIGREGQVLEDRVTRLMKRTKMRLIGTNCIGVYDPYSNVDTLFLSRERCGRPEKGNIAFITQSGAVGSTILDWLSEQNIGLSKFVSYGNATDVDETDLIKFLGKDKKTKVITVYLEGIEKDAKEFMKVCKKISKKKPIIILKAGKTKKGTEAVSSHTGSLAGSGKIYSSAFKQCGIIEAKNWQELFDFAKAFSTQDPPKGNKIAVITDGGGFGVLAADEADRQKINLEPAPPKLKRKIKKVMPSYAIYRNPIDLTGDATAERYKVVINESLKEYDGIIAIILMQVPTLGTEIVEHLGKIKSKKPILICSVGGKFTEKINKQMMELGYPVYPSPERAVKAMRALINYGR